MGKLYASIANETQKMLAQKTTIAFLALTLLLPLGSALLITFVKTNAAIQIMAGSNFAMTMLWLYVSFCLPLFVFMFAANLFVGEAGDRSLRLALLRPVSRLKVFLGKLTAQSLFIVVGLALMYLASVLFGGFLLHEWNIDEWMPILGAYSLAAIPMMVLGASAACVGQLFRSVGGALVFGLFAYGAAKIIPYLSPAIGKVLFTNYTDWYTLWLGGTATGGRLLMIAVILLSSAVLFVSGGYYLFEKKEM
ncbi:UNVERIFIED_CONTAM: ABC-2 type transport system permease protein [Brevibacillus sp. OAP136]